MGGGDGGWQERLYGGEVNSLVVILAILFGVPLVTSVVVVGSWLLGVWPSGVLPGWMMGWAIVILILAVSSVAEVAIEEWRERRKK